VFKGVIMQKPDIGLSGHFRLEIRDAATGRLRQELEFDNLILDSGLNRYGTLGIVGGIAIGTGTTAPAVTDTQLQTLAAWTTTSAASAGLVVGTGPNYITTQQWAYQFQAGQLNGTYSEVGFGWSSTGMFSRALILTGGGVPTTITVSSTEFLTVYYTLRIVPNTSDVAGSVVIGGVTYSTVRRPAYLGSSSYWRPLYSNARFVGANGAGTIAYVYDGALGAVTTGPSGNISQLYTYSDAAYVNNSLEKSGTITMELAYGNFPGGSISALLVTSSCCAYQYSFSPSIPKDNTRVITITGKLTWGRA